jgi:hypothetical protein
LIWFIFIENAVICGGKIKSEEVAFMSIESAIRDKDDKVEYSTRPALSFPTESIPYLLRALDAFIILLCCITGAIGYHLLIGGPLEVLPPCAVGLLASLIYILRMNGSGYYELRESAKPELEVHGILVCWFSTGLLLTLIAFLYPRSDCVAGVAKGFKNCAGACSGRENYW